MHDTQAYKPTLDAFTIPEISKSPATISADAAYDARNIRQYNRNRGIRSNIPANRRFRRLQNERPFWFDQEFYKERNAIERFFGWIEALKRLLLDMVLETSFPADPSACASMVGEL